MRLEHTAPRRLRASVPLLRSAVLLEADGVAGRGQADRVALLLETEQTLASLPPLRRETEHSGSHWLPLSVEDIDAGIT